MASSPPSAIYGTFEVGASPFRVKGVAYQGLRASFDARVPGGLEGVVARIDRPELTAFFAQPFLPSSTYDILPLLEASQSAARACGTPWREFVRAGSRLQAERDLGGVYRTLLRLASPRMVVDRIPRILTQYLSFGEVKGALTADTHWEAESRGIPQPVSSWMHAIAEGFVPVLLEAAGAKDVAMVFRPFSVEGRSAGVDLIHARFSVTWS